MGDGGREVKDDPNTIHALARNYYREMNNRPAWAYHLMRWCLGYKGCFYLDSLLIAADAMGEIK